MFILKFIVNHYKKFYIFPFWMILFFFSIGYRLVISFLRERGYKKVYPEVFILSIGNITSGGTGKTEVAYFLAKTFEKKRKSAVILRGYKGKDHKDAQIISKDSDIINVGDEALLLGHKLKGPVIVSKKRCKGVELAGSMKKDFIILDDAFQHWDLKRDLNLVLLDYTNPFSNNHLIPAGLLREPPCSLKHADCILITKYEKKIKNISLKQLENRIRKYNKKAPIFVSYYKLNKIVVNNRFIPFYKVRGKKIIILSSIANPDYFIAQVKEYLHPVQMEIMVFNDHYIYTEKDVSLIHKKLNEGYDYIITTEKDQVKLKKFDLSPLIFQIGLNLYEKDKFIKFISYKINSASKK